MAKFCNEYCESLCYSCAYYEDYYEYGESCGYGVCCLTDISTDAYSGQECESFECNNIEE
jgi:hypothetical protein